MLPLAAPPIWTVLPLLPLMFDAEPPIVTVWLPPFRFSPLDIEPPIRAPELLLSCLVPPLTLPTTVRPGAVETGALLPLMK